MKTLHALLLMLGVLAFAVGCKSTDTYSVEDGQQISVNVVGVT